MNEYYAKVASAFDRVAATYHADYAANPIQAWLEEESFQLLAKLLPPVGRVLEIGCGAGEMAVRLAEAGFTVVATDISPVMIAQAQASAAHSPAHERITWLAAPAGALAGRVMGAFDAAYSGFGPLNCEPDLGQVAESLAALIRPGGWFICSVMNRWCLWEVAWGLLRLRPREALRRLGRGWVQARMSAGPGQPASTIPVRYYTPGSFARYFARCFVPELVWGFPVLIPPPYLAGRFPAAVRKLASAEHHLRGRRGFRALGDHFLLALRRKDERTPCAAGAGEPR